MAKRCTPIFAFAEADLGNLPAQPRQPDLGLRFPPNQYVFFRTVFVFVIIELGSRRVVYFGVTRNPTDQWTAQQLREATPFGEGPRFLIRDNDEKFRPSFARVARGTGI